MNNRFSVSRLNRVESSTQQGRVVILFLFVSSFCFGQVTSIPDEMAVLKARFIEEISAINSQKNDDLNEKYIAGLSSARDKKQGEGDLDSVLALQKEIESIQKTGCPGAELAPAKSGLKRLRDIYKQSHEKWQSEQETTFRSVRAVYVSELEKLTVELTKANRLEEAIVVRNESKAALRFKWGTQKLAKLRSPFRNKPCRY